MAFPKASKEVCLEYEALKKEKMQEFNSRQDKMLNKPVKENKYEKRQQVADELKNQLDDFSKRGEIQLEKISTKFQIPMPEVKFVLALLDIKRNKDKKYLVKDFIPDSGVSGIVEKLKEYKGENDAGNLVGAL